MTDTPETSLEARVRSNCPLRDGPACSGKRCGRSRLASLYGAILSAPYSPVRAPPPVVRSIGACAAFGWGPALIEAPLGVHPLNTITDTTTHKTLCISPPTLFVITGENGLRKQRKSITQCGCNRCFFWTRICMSARGRPLTLHAVGLSQLVLSSRPAKVFICGSADAIHFTHQCGCDSEIGWMFWTG
jgi:hypothetical protein